MAKKFVVIKSEDNGRGIEKTQVGHVSKTMAQAEDLRARMRAVDAQRHGSAWYTTELR